MDTDQRIAELEARVAALTARFERTETADAPPVEDGATLETSASRRHMLRLVGGAAVVGAAAAVGSGALPAAADDPNDLTLGTAKATTGLTRADFNAGAPGGGLVTGFFFQAGQAANQVNYDALPISAALTGRTSTNTAPTGVFGTTNVGSGFGVAGINADPAGVGVQGSAATGVKGVGVTTGVLGTSSDLLGVGVSGTGTTGVKGVGTGIGVEGTTTGSFGVRGRGITGVLGVGDTAGLSGSVTLAAGHGVVGNGGTEGAGVRGDGGAFGVASARSTKANVYLQPNNNATGVTSLKLAPALRTDAHLVGELENVDGDLWWCVVAGTPGTWRKVAGATSAGAFHALAPGRVYDSRLAQPAGGVGPLANLQNRLISVADRRNLTTGVVDLANFVPSGATAITANVTVVNTVGSGFLSINPGGNTTVGSAAINWSAAGQILNNGLNLTLNATRQITVICGGGGTTDFVLDVSGYFL